MDNEFIVNVADTFDFGLIIENTNRDITFCNQKFIDIFDINDQPKNLLGKKAESIAYLMRPHFKDKELFDWGLKELPIQCIKYENSFDTLLNRTIKLKYTPLYIDSVVKRHVWQFEDITELELKELEIIKQKEYYLKLLDKIQTEIVVVNKNHEFEFINEFAIKDKKNKDFLIGKKLEDYSKINKKISIEKITERNHYYNKALELKSKIEYIEEFATEDGYSKFIYRTLNPVLDENNLVDFVVISGSDITKQVENEKDKKLLNTRFEKIINVINNVVFQIDFSGKIIFVNKAAFELFPFFGKTQDGYFTFINTQLISFADRMQCLKPFQFIIENKNEVNGVLKIGNEDTGIQYLKYTYWYSKTIEDGETIIGSVADVTSQYVELNAMKFAIEKEQQLNSMKSKFINITSHEIRTPLSVILSSAEIIDMTLPKENPDLIVNPKEYTETIMHEVQNVTNILNELLMVGNIESSNTKFKGEFVEIKSFIEMVTNRYSPFIDGRSLEVINSIEPLEQIFIDKKLMKHAIENLLNNAFKYSPGKNTPILSILKKDSDIIFIVQDFGIGIPADEINNLFQSFYRASNVSNISGTGIGLMVVEYAAKMHNGRVEVNSVQNGFSIFKLIIPNHYK